MKAFAIIGVVLIILICVLGQHGINYLFRTDDGDGGSFVVIMIEIVSLVILAIAIYCAIIIF